MDPVGINIFPGSQASPQSWLFFCCNLPDRSGNLSYLSQKSSRSAILAGFLQLLSDGRDPIAFRILPESQAVHMIQAASCSCYLPGGSSGDLAASLILHGKLGRQRDPSGPLVASICQVDPVEIHIFPGSQTVHMIPVSLLQLLSTRWIQRGPISFPEAKLVRNSGCYPAMIRSIDPAASLILHGKPGRPRDPSGPLAAGICQVDPAGPHILPRSQAGLQFWLLSCLDPLDGSGSLPYPSWEPGCPHDPNWPPAAAIYQMDPAGIHILLERWAVTFCSLILSVSLKKSKKIRYGIVYIMWWIFHTREGETNCIQLYEKSYKVS